MLEEYKNIHSLDDRSLALLNNLIEWIGPTQMYFSMLPVAIVDILKQLHIGLIDEKECRDRILIVCRLSDIDEEVEEVERYDEGEEYGEEDG